MHKLLIDYSLFVLCLYSVEDLEGNWGRGLPGVFENKFSFTSHAMYYVFNIAYFAKLSWKMLLVHVVTSRFFGVLEQQLCYKWSHNISMLKYKFMWYLYRHKNNKEKSSSKETTCYIHSSGGSRISRKGAWTL